MTLTTRTTILLVALFSVLALCLSSYAFAQGNQVEDNQVKVIIHFTEGAPEGVRHGLVRAFGGELTHSFSIIDAVAATIPLSAITGLEKNPYVTLIEEDNKVHALGVTYDQEYAQSWGVEHIESGFAHESGYRGVGVKIGIIDSGIDYTHLDLDDNYVGGYDFYYWDNDPMDVYGHGTHVAGTACAEDNDNGRIQKNAPFGVVGVAPECDLYSLRVLGDNGSGFESDIVYAIEYALGKEVDIFWLGEYKDTVQGVRMDVVNLSLGSEGAYGPASEAAFQAAADEGLIIVAAAGNSGNSAGTGENMIWPANFSSVIAVAATDPTDARASFSSTGANAELSAPGVSVYSTWNDNTSAYNPQPNCTPGRSSECYKYANGTSMASPHVAGVVALLISAGVPPADVRSVMQNSAIDLGGAGWDEQYGYGLVNVRLALGGSLPNLAPTASVSVEATEVLVGDTVTFTGTGSTDPNGDVLTYNWTFGDGASATGDAVTHSYTATGTYTAALTVSDGEFSDTDEVTISVVDVIVEPPQPDISLVGMSEKNKGEKFAYLTWTASAGMTVDIIRDGSDVADANTDGAGDGTFSESLGKGGGMYVYQVCQQGTTNCSNEITLSF